MLTSPTPPQTSCTGCAFLSILLEDSPSNFLCPCPFKVTKAQPPANAQGSSPAPRGAAELGAERGRLPSSQPELPEPWWHSLQPRWPLASPQAPQEAEAAADLIDMGPDQAPPTGSLSSQLAGMSKCIWGFWPRAQDGAAGTPAVWGCPLRQLGPECRQQSLAQTPPRWADPHCKVRQPGPNTWGSHPHSPQLPSPLGPQGPTVLQSPLDTEFSMVRAPGASTGESLKCPMPPPLCNGQEQALPHRSS